MKRFLLSVFRFYIEASIHVSLAVFALFQVFLLKNELRSDLYLSGVIFFGSITGYNFVKYAPVAKLHHRSLTRFFKGIQFFSLISFLGLVFFGLKLPLRTLQAFAIGGIFIFLYAIPVVLKKNLRSLSGAKIYIVAFSWVIAVVVAPALHFDLAIDHFFLMNCLQVFLLVVVLIIPFDIRDLNYDSKNLRTLPQVIGVVKAKLVAGVLLLLFLSIEFWIQKKPEALWASSLISILMAFMIYKTSTTNSKFYCSFYIESIPIIYWVLVLIT
ncbi:hypothetical protein [Aquimarina agarilytica]|uniref:hypothetical protein n=1 Tax=Aquimarina agarilytica TaxID=1087449 RepID=UPI00028884B1|nr:hypothetical protein [Aquimarina agarilytica]